MIRENFFLAPNFWTENITFICLRMSQKIASSTVNVTLIDTDNISDFTAMPPTVSNNWILNLFFLIKF